MLERVAARAKEFRSFPLRLRETNLDKIRLELHDLTRFHNFNGRHTQAK
jgi:hypothetical protein